MATQAAGEILGAARTLGGVNAVALDPQIGAIYRGTVMHHRKRPVSHHFTYQVFSLFLDIDKLEDIARELRFFAIDRLALISFHNKDHGPRDGSGLRAWVEDHLSRAGRPNRPARIMLLSMPRLLGYMFNPLSIYFCYAPGGGLESVVYEVKNTFGGQHVYVLGAPDDKHIVSHACGKDFFVSPFIDMQARYNFRLKPPGEKLTFGIQETDDKGCFFAASHRARRTELNNRNLMACLLAHGWMGMKVIAGIHVEALRLWLKGAPYFSRAVKQT